MNRKVHIDGDEWTYRIGRSIVAISSPTGEKTVAWIGEVMGMHSDDVIRGRFKKTSDGAITPSKVKSYIQEHLV